MGIGDRAPIVTFEALSDFGLFPSLDAKLGSAIAKICSGELGRKIQRADDLEAFKGRMMKGRQALWIIYEYFRVVGRGRRHGRPPRPDRRPP